ncbi:MAG: hypothetical protein IJ370_01920 [Oscillospiraceae bacterium]|nr:hypothetical protein [Oscillospiraceae bacterium]
MSKVKTTLKRFSYLRDYKVLENVKINEHTFDYLMIGVFGILSVCFFDEKGDLYGNENDENFVIVDKKSNRIKTENLIKKAKKDNEVLRSLISGAKIYNVKIDSIIVVDDKKCQPLFSATNVPVVKLSALSKFLNQEKFDVDNKADADKIVSLLTK